MELFRKKSLDRVSDPDKLNDYIRVTTPTVWLVLVAILLILLGMLAFSLLGTVEMTDSSGNVQVFHPISLVIG